MEKIVVHKCKVCGIILIDSSVKGLRCIDGRCDECSQKLFFYK